MSELPIKLIVPTLLDVLVSILLFFNFNVPWEVRLDKSVGSVGMMGQRSVGSLSLFIWEGGDVPDFALEFFQGG